MKEFKKSDLEGYAVKKQGNPEAAKVPEVVEIPPTPVEYYTQHLERAEDQLHREGTRLLLGGDAPKLHVGPISAFIVTRKLFAIGEKDQPPFVSFPQELAFLGQHQNWEEYRNKYRNSKSPAAAFCKKIPCGLVIEGDSPVPAEITVVGELNNPYESEAWQEKVQQFHNRKPGNLEKDTARYVRLREELGAAIKSYSINVVITNGDDVWQVSQPNVRSAGDYERFAQWHNHHPRYQFEIMLDELQRERRKEGRTPEEIGAEYEEIASTVMDREVTKTNLLLALLEQIAG